MYSTQAFCAATLNLLASSASTAWSMYRNGGATTISTLSAISPAFSPLHSSATLAMVPLHFQLPPTINLPVPSFLTTSDVRANARGVFEAHRVRKPAWDAPRRNAE